MDLTKRQKQIIEIVKQHEPITGNDIAEKLDIAKSTIRSDLSVLTLTGILDGRPKVGYIYSGLTFQPMLHETISGKVVEDIMSSPVIIQADTTVHDAMTMLFMYDVGSIFIAEGESNELLGVVSRKDLLRTMATGQANTTPVAIVMTRMPNIIVATKDMPVLEAGKLIVNHQVDSLPVIADTDSYEIIGRISKTSLVQLFVELSTTEG